MFTLRATGALLARWKVRPEPEAPPSETILGDWFATHAHYGRRQLLLAMSSKTLLPVVLDVVPARELVPRLSIELMKVLLALGVPSDAVDAELARMTQVTFAKTNDRRAVGSLTEFQRLAEECVERRHDPATASLFLAHTPCRVTTGGNGCVWPDADTLVAFGVPRAEAEARTRRRVAGDSSVSADRIAPPAPAEDVLPEREVVPFPPLPKVPAAPTFPPDPRQAGATRAIGAIARAVTGEMHVVGPNLSRGFHASAVDMGRLQQALERGLGRFGPSSLEERWSEVFSWIESVVQAWVQRCKRLRVERKGGGIRVEMQTQDDLGYYDYAFDVFPQRTVRG